jgi:hypothetical protein
MMNLLRFFESFDLLYQHEICLKILDSLLSKWVGHLIFIYLIIYSVNVCPLTYFVYFIGDTSAFITFIFFIGNFSVHLQ